MEAVRRNADSKLKEEHAERCDEMVVASLANAGHMTVQLTKANEDNVSLRRRNVSLDLACSGTLLTAISSGYSHRVLERCVSCFSCIAFANLTGCSIRSQLNLRPGTLIS